MHEATQKLTYLKYPLEEVYGESGNEQQKPKTLIMIMWVKGKGGNSSKKCWSITHNHACSAIQYFVSAGSLGLPEFGIFHVFSS